MSWVKAASFSGDDVFDESADELNLQSKEWASNMRKRIRDGYVDGVDAGEEASLQAGFNQGFRDGATQTVAVGRLKGIVSAVWCWCQIQHPESPVPASVIDLLQHVTQHEDRIMNDIKEALENPPPSVSDVSESMEDLGLKQGDCPEGGCKDSDCCRRAEKMDLDSPHQLQKLHSGSIDCSSSLGEDLNLLLQHCMDIVSELGLPQELIAHIEKLRNM